MYIIVIEYYSLSPLIIIKYNYTDAKHKFFSLITDRSQTINYKRVTLFHNNIELTKREFY